MNNTELLPFCKQLLAALDAYPIKPQKHRQLCNEVRRAIKDLESDSSCRANSEDWEFQEAWAKRGDEDSRCFLDLRARIAMLEAAMNTSQEGYDRG